MSDHDFAYKDFGTYNRNSCDYPDYAKLVCESILKQESQFGILICSTGIGISICANKFKGIRAALCSDSFSAKMCREHNNSNVLALGAKIIGEGLALNILETFLQTSFSNETRHMKRIAKIKSFES